MSTTNEQVRIELPSGTKAVGQVCSRIPHTDISGPGELVVVDVNGSQYRVPSDEVQPI